MTMQIPDYAQGPQRSYPFWNGAPKSYSFDGNTGKFSLGSEALGGVMYVQIFGYRWQEGERWGRNNQHWLDVACVDTEGAVAQLSLKKDSAINLHAYLARLESGKQFGQAVKTYAVWTKLEAMEQQTLEGEAYFVVVPTYSDFAGFEQVSSLEAFKQTGLFEWVLIGEVQP